MFLVEWFFDILASLGLWHKDARICLLGLDNAGKTTLLNRLYSGTLELSLPTQQPTANEFSIGSVNFTAFDLGGHRSARRLWKDYYAQLDAVIYLVDAYDQERLEESRMELNNLLSEESLATVPFLILGNKIDLPYAASEEELSSYLGLTNFTTGKGNVEVVGPDARPIEVFMCSIVRGMGYREGLEWLTQYIE